MEPMFQKRLRDYKQPGYIMRDEQISISGDQAEIPRFQLK